jgi:hypothetical protein
MRSILLRSALLSLLVLVYVASLGAAQGGAQDKLPRPVSESLSREIGGAEVVAAIKESEDGKECYRVTLMDEGQKHSVFVAPDGRFVGVITDGPVPADYPAIMLGFFACSIIGSLVAAGVRIICLQVWPEKRSVLREWLVGCAVTALIAGLLMSMVATVPREKDLGGLALASSVVGGLSASIVEAAALILRSARGHWKASRGRLVAICLTGVVFLCLSIPVAAYHRHWLKQNMRGHALRPTVAEAAAP